MVLGLRSSKWQKLSFSYGEGKLMLGDLILRASRLLVLAQLVKCCDCLMIMKVLSERLDLTPFI